MTPLRRVGTVADVAAACVFLASPASGFITGQQIAIDGGTSITDGS
jgi:NAD(P)-dependent dehydrogenase (short-subunit alcohol dehydrogenase family)